MVRNSLAVATLSFFSLAATYTPALADCCSAALDCCVGGLCCM